MSRILGMGVDITDVERHAGLLARHEERFVERVCLPSEAQRIAGGGPGAAALRLAGLFAAKEAVLKALGTGANEGLSFRQVEVLHSKLGAPRVVLHGEAAGRAAVLGVARIHLSISHERHHAIAVALLEGD
jgi:holo-[acyl-carrier protein] synthase